MAAPAITAAAGASKTWLVVAAVVAAIAMIGGGVAVAKSRGSDRPADTAQRRQDGSSRGDRSSSEGEQTGGANGDGTESDAGAGSGEPSTEAYCTVLEDEFALLQTRMQTTSDGLDSEDPGLEEFIGAFVLVAALPTDLAIIFEKAEEVAPDEIRMDTRLIKENFQQQADSMADTAGDAVSDPISAFLGALASGLVQGAQMQGPLDRFDAFTTANCDLPS